MQIRRGRYVRGAMMVIVASGLGAGVARADEDPMASGRSDDPFAMLQERGRAWSFELATGAALTSVVAVKGAPHARCEVQEVTTVGALRRSVIACAPVAEVEGDVAAALTQRFVLVFDDAGVREVVRDSEDAAELGDGSNAGAFTFPRTFERRWQHDVRRPDGARATVTVRDEPSGLRGMPEARWIAEATTRPAGRSYVKSVRSAAAFTPGRGPMLRCTVNQDSGPRYTCLRRIADPEPVRMPKPRAAAQVTLTSKTAHTKSSLTAATVAAKIAGAHMAAIRRCYGDLLRKKPAARGTLQLDFTVNAVGKVADPRVKASDDALASCVAGGMASWRFPIPQSEYGEPRDARFTLGFRLTPP